MEEEEKEMAMLRSVIRKISEEEATKEFICKICLEPFLGKNDVFPFELCEHVYHKDCLAVYVKSQLD